MNSPRMFGECLNDMMHKNHISIARLTQRVNYRSKTSLVRLLRDEVRYGSIEDFMDRLEKAEQPLFCECEMALLRESMEVSRLGRGRWRTYQSIWKLLRGGDEEQQVTIEGFGRSSVHTPQEMTDVWYRACRMEMMIVNAGYDSFISQVEKLLNERPDLDCTVRHYLTMRTEAGSIAVQLGALMRVVHDARYRGYCRLARPSGDEGMDGLGERYNLVLVEGELPDGNSFFQMICLKKPTEWLLYENEKAESFMPFVYSSLKDIWRNILPLKVEYLGSDLLEGLTAISQRYLSCERDRATCCLAPGICFEMIPMEILYGVMFDSVLKGCDRENQRVHTLCEVHRARYENVCAKGRPSTFILLWESLKHFARSGLTTDHVAGMRAFSAQERRQILDDVIQRCRIHENLNVYILRPEVDVRGMTLTTHEELGVYLLDTFTKYDVQKGHSEVFIAVPGFARALDEFFRDELIGKCTHSKEESLQMLCALRDSIAD